MRITNENLNGFKHYLIENECSSATISKYLHDVKCFENFAKDRTLNKDLILEYKNELASQYEKSSANSMLAALNSYFKFLGLQDLVVKRFRVQREVYCDESVELSEKEYYRLIKAAQQQGNERLFFLLQTIGSTGIRVSELSFFTVEALEKGKITITNKGKTRTVFVIRKLKEKLKKYIKKRGITTGPIFVTRTGKAIDRSNIWREMKKICVLARVSPQKVFPHNLRHLFARTFYRIEKDIAKLADLLGHSSIDTTRIYIISSGTEHRRLMENMRLVI